jgi:hypothetical protein
VYFGPAIVIGFSTPTTYAWTIPTLWGFAAALAAWGLHTITWNMNGLTDADFQGYVETVAAEERFADAKIAVMIGSRQKSE